ncbi:MAG: nicotinamide-nucleotide amidase [Gallionella sp.]|jgi:nicotinamide-nucleotide amidase|nr:nicotinamide-nucleotide amidase [Gallionella sp.]
MTSLAARVGAALQAHGLMLVTAESCTGGGVAQALTDIAGSSVWFERGFVTYSNLSKQQMLGVSQETLDRHGAVSEAVVREMAAGALRFSAAQLAVAVSGIAGPGGGSAEKPVGTVWLAWQLQDSRVITRCLQFAGDRAAVRKQAVEVALEGVFQLLAQQRAIV